MVFGVDMFYEELLIIKPDFHTLKYPATSGLEQLRQQTWWFRNLNQALARPQWIVEF